MQAELEAFEKALDNPARPLLAVVGGAKVSTKIELLGNLVTRVEMLVIGGAMANTFLAAQGKTRRQIAVRADLWRRAQTIMDKAKTAAARDPAAGRCGGGQEFKANAPSHVVDVDQVGADEMVLDVGPRSVEHFGLGAGARRRPWSGTARSALSRPSRSTTARWRRRKRPRN